jgi:Fur family transcriptional regulator, peroxide stress response regulator
MIIGMNTKNNPDNIHRDTRQRELILLILRNTDEHPTADRVYEQARKELPRISKGTVYRNLAVLVDEGKISALNLNGTITRYEVRQKPHYHFRCESCGKVIDLKQPVNKSLNKKVEMETGFKVSNHQLEFRGICLECQ